MKKMATKIDIESDEESMPELVDFVDSMNGESSIAVDYSNSRTTNDDKVNIEPEISSATVGENNVTPISSRVPVTILTGFLGSGKTTLLNYILNSTEHGKRIAVIENEFSEGLGVESMIAKSGVNGDDISNFFELPNGCICCTIKNDLLSTLEQLVIHRDKFDYIIIETTGLANPGPVISTFWTDEGIDR